MPQPTAIVDIKTLGPDPDHHPMWQIVVIHRADPYDPATDSIHWWQIRPSEQSLHNADSHTVEHSGYHAQMRVPRETSTVSFLAPAGPTRIEPADLDKEILALLDGAELIGATPNFDARFLRARLNAAPWNPRTLDITTLAAGFLLGKAHAYTGREPFWGTPPDYYASTRYLVEGRLPHRLSQGTGVRPPRPEPNRSALGNALWARRLHDRITLPPTLYAATHPSPVFADR
ncbi:hypothetical protein [Streptomyces xiamenensis]|uniref:hypothetical protein n=1 Tax=Streptomyces xiamenensis TaxID=408015 RepID=UPI0035DF3E95